MNSKGKPSVLVTVEITGRGYTHLFTRWFQGHRRLGRTIAWYCEQFGYKGADRPRRIELLFERVVR